MTLLLEKSANMAASTLSIIIPTKNRHELISALVSAIDGKIPDRITYIIHDNSDAPIALPLLKQSSRFIYAHDASKLSFGQNFSKALALSSSDYVCMMGDDDWALHSQLLEGMDRCDAELADALICPNVDLLFHPGTSTRFSGQYRSLSFVQLNAIGRALIQMIFRFSRATSGMKLFWLQQPDLWACPRAYFGLVRRRALLDCLPESANQQNIFLSPDSFMMGAMSRITKLTYQTRAIVVPGTSAKSGSQLSNVRQHVGPVFQNPNLSPADVARLPSNTPDYFFPEVFWACSCLSGLGSSRFSDVHLQTLKCFVALKYRVWMRETQKTPWYRPFTLLAGLCLGTGSFVANRILVCFLIFARYFCSKTQTIELSQLVEAHTNS